MTTVDGQINDEVELNNLGLACPAEDPEELSRKINLFLNIKRSDRQMMGIRARKLAEKSIQEKKLF